MRHTVFRSGGALLTALALAGVAACSDGGSPASGGSPGTTSADGGTLYYLTKRNAEHLDPQRINSGRDLDNMGRLVYRTLTAFPLATKGASGDVVPDLATDTGQASDGARTWSFTLKDGITWQDGSEITCTDVQYGISRTFATDVITGGANNAIRYLDIPTRPDGESKYPGPYDSTPAQQRLFDEAVSCAGKTVTFHLKRPVADFDKAVSLPAFSPYKKSEDHGDRGNYEVFSSGPYQLKGKWTSGGTSTFVRNPEWKRASDPLRKARPDRIVFVEGLTDEVIAQRLISDRGKDQYAVSDRSVPPALQPQVAGNPQALERSSNPETPFVEYLLPNFASGKMDNPLVRQALAVSTDKSSYITALGGDRMATPTTGTINPEAPGFKEYHPFGTAVGGDPAMGRQLLQKAGVQMPYPITYIYSGGTPTLDKAAASLKEGWEKAGFAVTLQPETQNYFGIVQNPAKSDTWDVCWMNWGSDWPGGETVIPPLWDSRINLSEGSNGADLGRYHSDSVNASIDAAFKISDSQKAGEAWAAIDRTLAKDVAYVPLVVDKFFLLHGSRVTDVGTSYYPDLGLVGLTP